MGIYLIFIHLARGNTTSLSHLFRYFTDGQLYWKATFLYGLTWIYINCWSLLLFIPGIIKYYAYSMAPYILIDHPELTPNQAITQSRKMMDGHKVELFALHLSFLGWGILCILTLGIGFLWLIPYISATDAQFYRKIRGEMDPIDPTDHPPL
ncbi:DUF975 family protein [Marininema halotolerans]|nr:DUF975 family protein [Marininema halotolerans]